MTDEGASAPTILKLTATIPQLLQVAPTFIFWSANDVLNRRRLRSAWGATFGHELDVTSTDKSLTTEIVPNLTRSIRSP